MSKLWIQILLVIFLALFNGLLAMSEMAVVSARRSRLQQRAERGDKGAKSALELASNPTRFLSTVQIGITLVGIFAGAFGGATIAQELAPLFASVSWLAPYAETLALVIVVLLTTYLSLVVGELVPKRLALSNPDGVASTVAPLMAILSHITGPVVRFLSFSTNALLRLLGIDPTQEETVTESDIRGLIRQATLAGVVEPVEENLVERVFLLDDRPVEALMTPRIDVVFVDVDDPPQTYWKQMIASQHTYFPVIKSRIDQVLGFVSVKDLWAQSVAGKPIDIMAALQEPLIVPETAIALDVLQKFHETGRVFAIVINEYGGPEGVVTLQDMVVSILGSVARGLEDVPEAFQREDGSWLVDARMPVEEALDILPVDSLPGQETGNFKTLSGFIMAALGRLPREGDRVEAGGFYFEVVDMDRRRVDKLLISPIEPDSTP